MGTLNLCYAFTKSSFLKLVRLVQVGYDPVPTQPCWDPSPAKGHEEVKQKVGAMQGAPGSVHVESLQSALQ